MGAIFCTCILYEPDCTTTMKPSCVAHLCFLYNIEQWQSCRLNHDRINKGISTDYSITQGFSLRMMDKRESEIIVIAKAL